MKPAPSMPKLTASERLRQDVEARCNSDEGLLTLARALLTHKPKSETELRYIRALLEYVFAKRRWEIYRKRGVQLRHAGCHDPVYQLQLELETAKERRNSFEEALALEKWPEYIRELKKRIGSQLSFQGAYRATQLYVTQASE